MRPNTVVGMITILCALVSLLSFRVRSRASLELELLALRHQVTVLRSSKTALRPSGLWAARRCSTSNANLL